MAAEDQTPRDEVKFDFSSFPPDTLFYDRRETLDRRGDAPHKARPVVAPPAAEVIPERRVRKERRRRVDPTTFEKQYTDDEIEFMNAMQNFKVQTGKAFPSHGEVLRVALGLGYRQYIFDGEPDSQDEIPVM